MERKRACYCLLTANPTPQHQVEPHEVCSRAREKATGPSEVDSSQQWIHRESIHVR